MEEIAIKEKLEAEENGDAESKDGSDHGHAKTGASRPGSREKS
eukprot:CAMPEP_0114577672 /NCGR_PEP_ID=MMETSP0125-20121206/2314_1 /TAXON_ID=485358 ORGANISM="Aristerostoma sp., Strain ATCC 50986" /NCGR_SAMPLE_ID=MMETSP0125 /ASSEMBLY_ACC=CAM_ASM_000245 /LENGTH=42 /DNA_ID= /DNA_START= /DNA_END= /DNA_ORIENTATION=